MSLAIIPLVALAGLGVGILSGLFGIGGGILMVPFMVLALDATQHVAEGTSLLVIIPTAIAGVLSHRRRGYLAFRHAGLLALGGLGGAYLGASLALDLSEDVLQSIFGILVAMTGARFLLKGIGTMRRERVGGGAGRG